MTGKAKIGNSEIVASRIALGCWRMNTVPFEDSMNLVSTALENGIDYFDHADIYGNGESEEIFGRILANQPGLRNKIYLQTKCGVRDGGLLNGYIDNSKEHILNAVDGSLSRLGTDHVDVLLLHRPDALIEPQEVAEAFATLHQSGKVRYFGVSNFNAMQIELLNQYLDQKILINQLQFSISHSAMIDSGLNVNQQNKKAVDHDGSILDYCRLKKITIQPWSPFQFGNIEGVYLGHPKFPELNKTIDRIAHEKGVTNSAIVIAWMLRHPAGMQPVVGTMNAGRLADISKAFDVTMTRPEWYEIYRTCDTRNL